MAFSKMHIVAMAVSAVALMPPGVVACTAAAGCGGGRRLQGAGLLDLFEDGATSLAVDGADAYADITAMSGISGLSEGDSSPWQTRKLVLDGGNVMHVSSYHKADRRGGSFYVSSSSQTEKYVKANFVGDDWYGSCGEFMLQIDEAHGDSKAPEQAKGWYLTVLKEVAADSLYEDHVRLVAHPDPYRAAKWYLDLVHPYEPGCSEYYLRVKYAPLQPQLEGAYLTIPPNSKRGTYSNYLAVGADKENALSITLE